MWELDYKESWVSKNWWFWTVVLDKTLESPLDYKEIQQVNAKGNQSWLFIGQTNDEAEAPILWPTDVKNLLIRKDLITGKDWKQEEKRTIEDEKTGWHHWLDEHEFEQAPGVGEGQGSLVCCSPWGCKQLDMTERLNWTYPIANTSCNCHVSPTNQGSTMPQHISWSSLHPCTVPRIHKAFSEFWLQGDLHFGRHREAKDTFILLSQTTWK